MSETDDDWLTVGEASRLLSVSPATLRRWAARDLILCIRTPTKQRKFPRSEVERLLRPQAA